MTKRLLLVLLLLTLVLGGIFGWKHLQAQRTSAEMSAPPPPAVVAAGAVQSESWRPYLRAVGSVVAYQGVSVTNEVAGKVSAILFESGHAVREGELLLQLDDSVDRADLAGLEAERRLAQVQYDRSARLLRQKSASRSDYDAAKAHLDRADANLASKRAVIDKKAIRAPFGGRLGIRLVDVGEYLAPGSRIVPLQALDPIYVDYALPERHFADLAVGQGIEVEVQAYPGQTFKGEISAINPGVDPGVRSVRLRATLPNPDQRLRPGMFAQVRTELPAREDMLTLPRTAVTYNPYGDSVFVIQDADGALVVQRRQITTGEVRADRVEIASGLELGERVVVAGQVKLRNGQAVRIDNAVALEGGVSGP